MGYACGLDDAAALSHYLHASSGVVFGCDVMLDVWLGRAQNQRVEMDDPENEESNKGYVGIIKGSKIACECGCEQTMKGEIRTHPGQFAWLFLYVPSVRITFGFWADRAGSSVYSWCE